ncbi:hypothetical protein SAMN06265222_1641 [Neorhodopirellula lusitana]|uniref:Uncharacterized protein n=1 Tax=Neorhodopirellula lusitana TaxID=445327 RepID=A0ABY1QUJ3_9BACT|nr:hypothetical protein [Neorhodopirellula lusitana]SMP80805.1 hypothetical protein SAMN06265222_1641 [Neorhodopirellula lusitana]
MSPLALLVLLMALALPVVWAFGEATDNPVLRRIAGPLFVIAICAVSVAATAIHVGFDSSIRYTGAVDEFVDELLATADADGPDAAVDKLRSFDRVSMQTYEGGAILRWEEHVDDGGG